MSSNVDFDKIVLSFATIIKIDEQIFENIIHKGCEVDVKEINELREANLKLANGKKYAILATLEEFASATKTAREFAASQEFVKDTIANAIFVEHTGHKIVGNFYIKVNKPKINTKLFTDKQKAIDWLYLQLKKIK
jgi:hypothetical protein